MHRLAILLLLAAFPVAAQICPALEFAEMEAMKAEELLDVRCEYDRRADAVMVDMTKGSLTEGQIRLSMANQCAQQSGRMDRILARKYGIGSAPNQHTAEITRRCKEKK